MTPLRATRLAPEKQSQVGASCPDLLCGDSAGTFRVPRSFTDREHENLA